MQLKTVKKPATKRRTTAKKVPDSAGKKPEITAKKADQQTAVQEFVPHRRFRV